MIADKQQQQQSTTITNDENNNNSNDFSELKENEENNNNDDENNDNNNINNNEFSSDRLRRKRKVISIYTNNNNNNVFLSPSKTRGKSKIPDPPLPDITIDDLVENNNNNNINKPVENTIFTVAPKSEDLVPELARSAIRDLVSDFSSHWLDTGTKSNYRNRESSYRSVVLCSVDLLATGQLGMGVKEQDGCYFCCLWCCCN